MMPLAAMKSPLLNSFVLASARPGQFHPVQQVLQFGQTKSQNTDQLKTSLDAAQIAEMQKKLGLVQQLLQPQGVSSTFEQQVKGLLLVKMPATILQDLADTGYQVNLKHHITAGEPEKEAKQFYLNERGGLNEPAEKRTTVAEKIYQLKSEPPVWLENQYWQNAIIHELGHVLADRIGKGLAEELPAESQDKDRMAQWGASEHPLFRTAWEKDFQAMSPNVRLPEGPIGYYLLDHAKNPYGIGRQETFAECVDILLRGSDSSYNYRNFNTHFPQTLEAVKQLIEQFFEVRLSRISNPAPAA